MTTARPRQRFQDIIENIDNIGEFCAGVEREGFRDNKEKSFAVQLALLRISEAARKLGEIAENLEPAIPWDEVRGLGSVIRHDYDQVQEDITWEIVQNDLAPLREACVRALSRLDLEGHGLKDGE